MDKRQYLKDFMIILSGNSAAQAVNLLSYPFLGRLYTPREFGIFATFVAVSAIPGAIACGRFDLAVTIAPRWGRSGVLWICLAISAAAGALSAAGAGLYWSLTSTNGSLWMPLLLGLTVMLTGVCAAETMYLMRNDRYRASSASLVVRTGGAVAAQIGLAFISAAALSLIIGFTFGLVAQALMLSLVIWRRMNPGPPKARHMRAMFMRFRRQVTLDIPSTLLAAFSINILTIFLGTLYGQRAVGFYSIGNRMAAVPIQLLTQAFGQIFYQAAARAQETKGHFWEEMKFGFITSGLLSLGVLAAIVLFARPFINVYLGPTWSPATTMLIILAPMLTVSSVAQTITTAVFVLQRTHWRLIQTVVALALHGVTFGIAFIFHLDVMMYLILVSAIFVIDWTAYAAILVVASRRHAMSAKPLAPLKPAEAAINLSGISDR